MIAVIFVGTSMVVGCSRELPARKPDQSDSSAPRDSKEQAKPRDIATGGVTITAREDQGQTAWIVKAESSRTTLTQDQTSIGTLRKVTADLFEDGKIASRLFADEAVANQSTKELFAKGNVRIVADQLPNSSTTQSPEPTVLTANEMEWGQDKSFVRAKGAVTVKSNVFILGPFPELWATPDLTKFGTPNQFKP
ncbi:MAG: LPS export ABC transporter periplasmic protein LptC [Fimbriimonadaceae bacterium]|jgi:hypothetical protein|nr:LPS export ABC transporter periplasmic protein LptC [Fimbriimonadaceae bacterium]